MRTLTIDIGGTGIKLLPINDTGQAFTTRHRELTPRPSTPDAVMTVIREMVGVQDPFDRVSVGFPGVVRHGVIDTAPNLGTPQWKGFNLQKAVTDVCGKPARVLNDAELQGFGVISGTGVEIVLTLGTGLGSALYIDSHLVPNLELGHHPLRSGKTYEDLVSDVELERVGKQEWRKRITFVIETLDRIFNYDTLHIGGGNAQKLKRPLPEDVYLFDAVDGLAGGVRLWQGD